ncbi:minor tail protein [Mycobacterium phage Reindeer]|uniref:Minor tail protein n=1 Tax=Mycobacterium phage Reindeer TaxID=2762283 RepID=A0A7G8LHW8_9CAUD|nr:minor tail protein [Mycobacterium phage Reindeer]QNJ56840.1 minor tail protein [Mycobacterium phage Reindeer]
MPWAPTPTFSQRVPQPGWFPEVPAADPVAHAPAWFPFWRLLVGDEGVGSDSATLRAAILAAGDGVGTDVASMTFPGLVGVDHGVGSDLADLGLVGVDQGVGADLAGVGLYAVDLGAGSDGALVKLFFVVGDQACGADVAALLIPMGTHAAQGVGSDSATAGFATHAPLAASFTNAGAYTFTIPVWCRYIDVILLGGGGGGRGMINLGAWGEGGWGGNWAIYTLERGVHIPWTARTITGVVGAGGAGSASGFAPARGKTGESTTAATDGWSGVATGGVGGQNAVEPNGRAVSPLTQTVTGQTYTGGGVVVPSTTGPAAGAVPGGGGSAAITTFQSGATGGRGRAWFYCYQ